MKNLSRFVVVASLLSSFGASAAEKPTLYSQEAVQLANVLSHCQKDITEFTESAPSASVASVTQQVLGLEGESEYFVQFEAGGIAPSFKRYSLGSLRITTHWTTSPNFSVNRMDAPGRTLVYSCEAFNSKGESKRLLKKLENTQFKAAILKGIYDRYRESAAKNAVCRPLMDDAADLARIAFATEELKTAEGLTEKMVAASRISDLYRKMLDRYMRTAGSKTECNVSPDPAAELQGIRQLEQN